MAATRRRFLPLIALGLLVALVAAACGDDSASDASGPDGGDADDADTPILVIETEGAFVTQETAFSMLPSQVVYADGRVVTMGAQILIYPGPALPALFESQLSPAGLERLEAAMREAGLDRTDVDYGTTNLADAGDAVVTVRVDGTTYTHRANALDYDDESLTDDQRAARVELQAFLASVTNLGELAGPGNLSGDVGYQIDRFRLWVREATEMEPVEGDPEPSVVEWTVGSVTLADSDCLAVEGEAATELAALLADANQLTRFGDGQSEWVVVARPVLPHETACPS